MMSKETEERIRAMTNAQRLEMTLEMIRFNLPAMLYGPSEVVDRRFELLRRQNDERNRIVLERLASTRNHGPAV